MSVNEKCLSSHERIHFQDFVPTGRQDSLVEKLRPSKTYTAVRFRFLSLFYHKNISPSSISAQTDYIFIKLYIDSVYGRYSACFVQHIELKFYTEYLPKILFRKHHIKIIFVIGVFRDSFFTYNVNLTVQLIWFAVVGNFRTIPETIIIIFSCLSE